jgi:hypothetical protein
MWYRHTAPFAKLRSATQGTRYIPFQHLRIKETASDVQVSGHVFTRDQVARWLDIPEWRLPELAALCGNDIMSEFMDKYRIPSALGIKVVASDEAGRERCNPQVRHVHLVVNFHALFLHLSHNYRLELENTGRKAVVHTDTAQCMNKHDRMTIGTIKRAGTHTHTHTHTHEVLQDTDTHAYRPTHLHMHEHRTQPNFCALCQRTSALTRSEKSRRGSKKTPKWHTPCASTTSSTTRNSATRT